MSAGNSDVAGKSVNEDWPYLATFTSGIIRKLGWDSTNTTTTLSSKRFKRSAPKTMSENATSADDGTDTTEINMNCYTRVEFLVLMGFIMLVLLSCITLFICVFLVHNHCCVGANAIRRGSTGHRHPSRMQSGQNFMPCKWWMNRDDDSVHGSQGEAARSLSELFHDRVSKLRRDSQHKEFMQRLIPAEECNGTSRLSYTTVPSSKMFSDNEKKLLISVPRGNIQLYGS